MKARSILLLIALVVELGLLFCCIFRKSNHVPAGYICMILCIPLIAATGWLLLFPKVTPIATTGQYEIVLQDDFYTDANRLETYADDGSKRELPVSFWYPDSKELHGTCPLVVFSHGAFGVKENNETLYRELASHGYVVCSVVHPYHAWSAKMSNGKTVHISWDFMKESGADEPNKTPEKSVAFFEKCMKLRTDDLNFVIDTILDKAGESTKAGVYDCIDTEKICVMGHSLGGSAALGIGRQRNDIDAVIALESPFMCDIKGVDETDNFIFEDAAYPVPVLNVYSDASWSHLKEWKQYGENAKMLDMESEDIENIHIEGIGHFGLCDLSLTSPFLTMVFDGGSPKVGPDKALKELNDICLTFLNNKLKNH